MELFEAFKEFIKPELLILIPVLYLIGIGMKKSEIKDKFIPLLLGTIAVILFVCVSFGLYSYITAGFPRSESLLFNT